MLRSFSSTLVPLEKRNFKNCLKPSTNPSLAALLFREHEHTFQAKVQQWKFRSFKNTNFKALLNRRFGRTICEGGHFTCVEAWRVCESPFERIFERKLECYLNPILNIPSKWTKILCATCESRRQRRKSIDFVGEVPTVFGLCRDNFHCWVLPGTGLFHQFFKTIFGFGSMWQLQDHYNIYRIIKIST